MAFQEMQRVPLWEHVAESGRFADYAVHSTQQPWNLVGRVMLSCVSLFGSVADVAQISHWGQVAAGSILPAGSSHIGRGDWIAADKSIAIDEHETLEAFATPGF